MSDEGTALAKRLAAALNVADEGFDVYAPLLDEGTAARKRLAAALNVTDTDKELLARVNALVTAAYPAIREALPQLFMSQTNGRSPVADEVTIY